MCSRARCTDRVKTWEIKHGEKKILSIIYGLRYFNNILHVLNKIQSQQQLKKMELLYRPKCLTLEMEEKKNDYFMKKRNER